jgi:hypothetical protein
MTIDEIKEVIITDLTAELMFTEGDLFNLPLLTSKVNNAANEVMYARNYPISYTQGKIEDDMYRHYTIIRNLALYDYNQTGAEGQKSFSGDGNVIHYVERDKIFAQVKPISRVY